jgi:hypothetical protein
MTNPTPPKVQRYPEIWWHKNGRLRIQVTNSYYLEKLEPGEIFIKFVNGFNIFEGWAYGHGTRYRLARSKSWQFIGEIK